MEYQEQKALYGENWKTVLKQKIEEEMKLEIGSSNTPKIYNSQDLYEFFDPVLFYQDKDNESLNLDFNRFIESERKYNAAINKLNDELEKLNAKNATENDDPSGNEEKELLKKIFQEDGFSKDDLVLPVVQDDEVESGEKSKDEETLQATKKTLIKASPIAVAKGRLNALVSKYFNRYVPVYNKYICSCCGVPKVLDQYYVVYNPICSARVDNKGSYHMHICKECAQKLFAYCYTVLADKNVELAMQYTCAHLDLYWDIDLFQVAKKNFEDSDRQGTLLGSYIITINKNHPGVTFMDSQCMQEGYDHTKEKKVVQDVSEAPYDWSAEDARNKKAVINMVGYDPFSYESNDDNKRILYTDLMAIIDDDIAQDYVKLQSAISIVKSFFKVRQLDEKQYKMEQEDASLTDQKAISDLKAKELKAITDFAAANGFSERFKTKQSRGENTFTGVVARMDKQKFEKGIANRFDVATSETIQQASDASFKSIFTQLSLSESDMFKVTADQLKELRKLRNENLKLQEDLRVAKYDLAQIKLEMKANQKGEG